MSKLTAIVNLSYDESGGRTTPEVFQCNGLETRIKVNLVCCYAEAKCDDPDKMQGWHDELKTYVKDVMRTRYETTPKEEMARLWWMP